MPEFEMTQNEPIEKPVVVDDSEILNKVGMLMKKIKMNKELQKMSEEQGLDVKNYAKLTDDTTENVTIAVIALLLAQQEHDPRYARLTKVGVQHRSLRTELINAYKNSAIQIIGRYKKSLKENAE